MEQFSPSSLDIPNWSELHTSEKLNNDLQYRWASKYVCVPYMHRGKKQLIINLQMSFSLTALWLSISSVNSFFNTQA